MNPSSNNFTFISKHVTMNHIEQSKPPLGSIVTVRDYVIGNMLDRIIFKLKASIHSIFLFI